VSTTLRVTPKIKFHENIFLEVHATDATELRKRPYYPLGTTDTMPRAYEGMEGRRNKNKEMRNRKM
jgi:hypothetical protein